MSPLRQQGGRVAIRRSVATQLTLGAHNATNGVAFFTAIRLFAFGILVRGTCLSFRRPVTTVSGTFMAKTAMLHDESSPYLCS